MSVINTTPVTPVHERNSHDHKTKRGDQKGNSGAEIEVGWQESSQKEGESHC